MRMDIDFIIFYEGINREMDSISLLKCELERRGYSVIISHCISCDYTITKKYNPKVVLTPWLRFDENIYRFTRLYKSNPKIVNLQWEQVFSKYGLETGLEVKKDSAKEAYHLCWGESTVERLVKEGVRRENLFNVGNISLDFCKPIFHDYYLNRNEVADREHISIDKKWILYISSFSYDIYDDATMQELDSHSSGSYREMMDSSNSSREATLDWIESYLKEYSDKEYIYRPHPSEINHPRIERMERKYSNFHVCTNYNIKQWILVSDIIQLWNSTSIAEVYLMNKKCSIIRPLPLNDLYQAEYYPGSINITEYDKFLDNCINGDANLEFPIKPEIMMSYYSNQEEYAFIRTADALVNILNSDKSQNLITNIEFAKRIYYFRKDCASLLCSYAFKSNRFYSMCKRTKINAFAGMASSADRKRSIIKIQEKIEGYYKDKILSTIVK